MVSLNTRGEPHELAGAAAAAADGDMNGLAAQIEQGRLKYVRTKSRKNLFYTPLHIQYTRDSLATSQ